MFNPVLSAVCDEGQWVEGVKCGVTAGALSFCTVTPREKESRINRTAVFNLGSTDSSLSFMANLSLGSYVVS